VTLPDWNNLESVKEASSLAAIAALCCWVALVVAEIVAHVWKTRKAVFEVAALVAFVLAVGGEIIGYKYNHRKDDLYDQWQQTVTDAANQKIDKSRTEAKEAGARAGAIQTELDDLKHAQAWRELTQSQRSLLIKTLSPFKGTNLMVIYMMAGGEETQHYAEEIASAIRSAGWDVGVNAGSHDGDPRYDLTVVVNAEKHPHAATVLMESLKQAKFYDVQGEASEDISINTIELIVRPKNPSKRKSPKPQS
jgi:hypothetical protein